MKAIPNFIGYYADKDGNIWSMKPFRNKAPLPLKPRKMKLQFSHQGYYRLKLRINGKNKIKFVHNLILETFVSSRPEGMQGCHNNGIRTDNRLKNLRWDTPKNNTNDMIKHGTRRFGHKHHNAKLNELKVRVMRKLRYKLTRQEIADFFKVSRHTVDSIFYNESWVWLR